jgi:hypothetical protein
MAGSIPNLKWLVEELAAQYPGEWTAAHRGGAGTEDFVRRLAFEANKLDPGFGLNGKRGNASDLSDDCLNYKGVKAGGDFDPNDPSSKVTVIDFIAAAPSGPTGPNGTPAWNYPLDPAAAAWVKPTPVAGGGGGNGGGGGGGTPPAGLTRAEVQAMIDASIAPLPKYGDKIGLQAWGNPEAGRPGKVLCAEQGGPEEDNQPFNLTSRSGVGPWEQWTILRP